MWLQSRFPAKTEGAPLELVVNFPHQGLVSISSMPHSKLYTVQVTAPYVYSAYPVNVRHKLDYVRVGTLSRITQLCSPASLKHHGKGRDT